MNSQTMLADIRGQLEAAGAHVDRVVSVAEDGWVVWRRSDWCPFADRPFVAHPVRGGRLAGSGVWDLTLGEAKLLGVG